ncbi:34044_t:CDS:2, partial [Gigaspora margarita]
ILSLSNAWNLIIVNELRKWTNLLKKKAEVLACNMKEKKIQSKVELRFEEENFYQNSELVVEETENRKKNIGQKAG